MEDFVEDGNLQACGCDAISAVVAALPVGGELQARIFEAKTHLAVGQALRWYIMGRRGEVWVISYAKSKNRVMYPKNDCTSCRQR